MDRLPQVVVIVGPTSSGKSGLAIELARAFNGEIVSADSRQVYRGMDIGTATPTADEQAAVPHHLINIRNADEEYSVAEYVTDAHAAIAGILERGKLPIIAGGTGLYIRGLIDGISIPEVAPNPELRAELEQLSTDELAARLTEVDRELAQTVDLHNPRRVMRALEVNAAGVPREEPAESQRYDALKIGLNPDKEILNQRILENVRWRFENGLLDEVSGLLEQGIDRALLTERVIAYGPALKVLDGSLTKDEAIERTATLDRQYAKRQRTWFKTDSEINWLAQPADATPFVHSWLRHEVTA